MIHRGKIFGTMCAIIFVASCGTLQKVDAIGACIEAYETHAKRRISTNIDRVYVDSYPASTVIHFAKGESGLFGSKSKDYESWFLCGVTNKTDWPVYKITDLSRSLGRIYSTADADKLFEMQSEYLQENDVETCWFERVDDQFVLQSCKKWR